MEIRADELVVATFCEACKAQTHDVFVLDITLETQFYLCFPCVLKLRDLCHEVTCEKDVTGKCDCWEGER